MTSRKLLSWAAALTIVTAPAVAVACPYCAGTADGNRSGYVWATALMLLLVVALATTFVLWLSRALKQRS